MVKFLFLATLVGGSLVNIYGSTSQGDVRLASEDGFVEHEYEFLEVRKLVFHESNLSGYDTEEIKEYDENFEEEDEAIEEAEILEEFIDLIIEATTS